MEIIAAMKISISDPRVRHWFLMQSPLIPVAIILLYLYFVTTLGPKLMKNRAPFQVENVIIFYNVVQVLSAAYIVKEVSVEASTK